MCVTTPRVSLKRKLTGTKRIAKNKCQLTIVTCVNHALNINNLKLAKD